MPSLLDRLGTLGDLTRCRLLSLLDGREFTVTELCQVLQMPQPTVSRHLKVLADEGWVTARARGTTRWYRRVDPLPPGARELWALVRGDVAATTQADEDRERAMSVLALREDRGRAFVSESAEHWDDLRAELYGGAVDLLPMFGLLDPAWTLADLGTGTGALPVAVAPYVGRAIGVDRSPEMLASARRRARGLDNVELVEADLAALPLEDGGVDLAVLSLVLHFVADPGAVLAEVRRTLRPGGRLLLVDLRAHDRAEYPEEMGHLWPGFEAEQISAWLTGAGLVPGPRHLVAPDTEARGPMLFLQTAQSPFS
jgi:ArsR family transcriptional regulator